MEQTNNTAAMLQLMDRGAFWVVKGMIVQVNDTARKYGITEGMSIESMLLTGAQEYAEFTNGCLYLKLKLAGLPQDASVTAFNDYHLFRLEHEETQQDLQVMALAAQELRKPLANVMTVADQLFPMESEDTDPKLQDQLSRINRGLFQMLRIISNMSDGYRYCADSHPATQIHNITGIIRETVSNAAALLDRTGLKIRFSEPQEDVYCLANSERIERAITNLLSNALKFAPKDSTVDIAVTQKKNMLYITVKNCYDNASALHSDAYDRYHRQPGIEDSRFGIGLGLVLVRSTATAHGGTVLMEQSPKHGTRVTMTLEIRQNTDPIVRNIPLHADYAGERDHLLLEFSESLSAEFYKK